MKTVDFALAILILALSVTTLAANKVSRKKNPLLEDWWLGPYGGVPPFSKVKLQHFVPALEAGMKQSREQAKAIAENSEPPTFKNTIEAWEGSGKILSQVFPIYGIWGSNISTAEFRDIEKEMTPKLSAFRDELFQNPKLFKRIEAVYNSPEKSKLTPEQQRLTWYFYNEFVLQGARLNDEEKAKISSVNQKLASLETQFSKNLLADEEDEFLVIESKSDLDGLPSFSIDAASAEADRKKLKGKWVFPNTRSSVEPFLTYASNRGLREKAFKMWTSRGDSKNANDNNKIVTEILQLRTEKAKILGFPTYADWKLSDTMAKKPQAAMELMMKVWKPAVAQVKKEVADLQAIVDQEKGGFKIQPWDYRYYAEKVRKEKYDLDLNVVKPYLQLSNVLKGLFLSAEKLFGLKFVKLTGVPVYHPDVTVYKVVGRNGKQVGLWYFDPFARAGKNSGAWMNSYREQSRSGGKNLLPIVSNNSNFIPGKKNEPVLLSWDDAITMFHEFGHAIHGLSSNITYGAISGTNVARDYVEFPSQVYEHFFETPEVMKLLKNKNGKVLPKELIEKIAKTRTFNKGFSTVEFLASAIVDMKLHLAAEASIDPAAFEAKTLKELGMPTEIVMRHRIPGFGHLFSGDGYAAGYYGYLWAQVLDNDAFEAFTEAGNPFDKKVAKKLYENVFSVGNSIDPAEGFRHFRGRDPKVDALLRARGFPVNETTTQ